MSKYKREVVLGLLTEMGADFSPKITDERALEKLKRYANRKGIKGKLTDEESAALSAAGVFDNGEDTDKSKAKKVKSKSKDKTATKVKSKSKAKGNGKAKKEKTAAKPKKEKVKRLAWIEAGALAALEMKTVDGAIKHAKKKYLDAGGRMVDGIDKNAVLNTTRAIKVLVIAGKISVNDNAIKHK